MIRYVITESSIHYAMAFLERYASDYQTTKHKTALKDFRDLSNKLLENLQHPLTLNVIRHNLKK